MYVTKIGQLANAGHPGTFLTAKINKQWGLINFVTIAY